MPHFPLLDIPRSAGDQALLGYKLTEDEKRLFREIDDATGKLPVETPLKEYHAVAAAIGAKAGLSRQQSIAFFVRSTFSIFEPE